jgi:hypothetical protein
MKRLIPFAVLAVLGLVIAGKISLAITLFLVLFGIIALFWVGLIMFRLFHFSFVGVKKAVGHLLKDWAY